METPRSAPVPTPAKAPTPLPHDAKVANPAPRERGRFFSRYQTLINFWLDTTLLVLLVFVLWVSVVIRFVFPPAGAATGYLLWGSTLAEWMDLHFALIALFGAGIVLHLMLHWPWVCGVLQTKILPRKGKGPMHDGQRTILGVGLLIVLLNVMGLGIAAAVLMVQSPL